VKVVTLGDAALDVLVVLERAPVPDDDVPAAITLAPGGQAANVAAWCAALGAESALVTRLADDLPGRLVRAELERGGVEVRAAPALRSAVIVSFVTPDGKRSMASDRGSPEPMQLEPGSVEGADWLHLSGYELLAPGGGTAAIAASEAVAGAGGTVSVDLSASTVVGALGAAETSRRIGAARASVVFATEAELAAAGGLEDVPGLRTLVVKRGRAGVRVREHGDWRELAAEPAQVRDPTGAGDALAAGWIVGGPATALGAAAAAVGQVGAFPAGAAGTVRQPRP
jgi:sugar/nucleoside kinase (ribokinase family)